MSVKHLPASAIAAARLKLLPIEKEVAKLSPSLYVCEMLFGWHRTNDCQTTKKILLLWSTWFTFLLVFSVYLSSLSSLENTEGNFLVVLALGFSHGKSQVIHELLIFDSYVSHMTQFEKWD
jgi:hypothetical protein